MKHLPRIVTALGLMATFFAVVLNLVPTTPATARTLALQSLIAAIIAIASGVYIFRLNGGWRFLAITMIGPSAFALTESVMQLVLDLRH